MGREAPDQTRQRRSFGEPPGEHAGEHPEGDERKRDQQRPARDVLEPRLREAPPQEEPGEPCQPHHRRGENGDERTPHEPRGRPHPLDQEAERRQGEQGGKPRTQRVDDGHCPRLVAREERVARTVVGAPAPGEARREVPHHRDGGQEEQRQHEHGRGDHDPGGATVEAAAREGQDDVHDERPYEEAGNAAGAVDPGVARERQRHHRDRRAQGDEEGSEPARSTRPRIAADADEQRDAERIERHGDRLVGMAAQRDDDDGDAGQHGAPDHERGGGRRQPPRPPPVPHRPGDVSCCVHA